MLDAHQSTSEFRTRGCKLTAFIEALVAFTVNASMCTVQALILGTYAICLQVKTESDAGPRKAMSEEDSRKLFQFREKAVKKVRSHVKLVVEDVKSESMKKIFRQTALSEWRGETIHTMSEMLA